MDDFPPLAVPLYATPESLVEQVKHVADGEEALTMDREGATDAVGITMITGYLGAGKTTVSGIDSEIDGESPVLVWAHGLVD